MLVGGFEDCAWCGEPGLIVPLLPIVVLVIWMDMRIRRRGREGRGRTMLPIPL